MGRNASRIVGRPGSGRSVVAGAIVVGGLALFVVVAFLGVVLGGGLLLGLDPPATGLALVATALVAFGFEPVRERLSRAVDRLLHGHRSTPWESVNRLSIEMGRDQDPDDVLVSLAHVIRDGTGADRVTVWVRLGQTLVPAAAVPDLPDRQPVAMPDELLTALGADLAVPIHQADDVLGAITVAGAPDREMLSIEVKLVEDLAAASSVVMRTVQLRHSLRRRLEVARHQRERLIEARARTADAQLAERQHLERDIHDTCQQRAVVLAGKLGLAGSQARSDPAVAAALLGEVGADIDRLQDALGRVAAGRPLPTLLGEGIGPALHAETADLGVRVDVDDETSRRFPRAVEEAVYSCCMEAIQNAVKHAAASRVEVRLQAGADELVVTVRDNGIGFDADRPTSGVGLRNMRDRLADVGGRLVLQSSAGGTTVSADVPVTSPMAVP